MHLKQGWATPENRPMCAQILERIVANPRPYFAELLPRDSNAERALAELSTESLERVARELARYVMQPGSLHVEAKLSRARPAGGPPRIVVDCAFSEAPAPDSFSVRITLPQTCLFLGD